jgi:hypothetical protein
MRLSGYLKKKNLRGKEKKKRKGRELKRRIMKG